MNRTFSKWTNTLRYNQHCRFQTAECAEWCAPKHQLGAHTLLFYVNDMPQSVDKEVIKALFAYDSKEYKVIRSIKDGLCLQCALFNFLVWFTL